MKLFTRELKIGIFGIVALFLLIYGINYLKGINMFQPSNYFYVRYSNILGLTKSSAVFADGYKIGLVRDIHYDYNAPGNVIVEIQLDTEMKLPRGTYAELSTEMLGGVDMNLVLPKRIQAYYTPGDTLQGRAKTSLMDEVSADVMPRVQDMLPKIDSILTVINTLLANPNITTGMEQARITSENLAIVTANLKSFTSNDLPQLTQTVNKVGGNLEQFTSKLNELEFSQTLAKVDATMSNVQEMTEQLNRKDNTIGLLLHDDSLYVNLNKTAVNASLLLQDLKANPKRYVHFSIFGRKN